MLHQTVLRRKNYVDNEEDFVENNLSFVNYVPMIV
jgi:hypothetical protein